MQILATCLSLFLASCLLQPAAPASTVAAAPRAPAPQGAVAALFPPAKTKITIPASEVGGVSLDRVLADFEKSTGLHLAVSAQTRQLVLNTPCGLAGPLEIPAAEVYAVIEGLLAQNDFVLLPISAREPRVAALESLQTQARNQVRQYAWNVDAGELAALVDHPAVLVQTVLDLEGIDARQLSGSMRSLLVDTNLQQIVPMGNSDQVLLLGTGRQVAGWAALLRDAAQREKARQEEERERREKERAEQRAEREKQTPAPR